MTPTREQALTPEAERLLACLRVLLRKAEGSGVKWQAVEGHAWPYTDFGRSAITITLDMPPSFGKWRGPLP